MPGPQTILRMAAAVGLKLDYLPESFRVAGELPTDGIIRGFGYGKRIDPELKKRLKEG